LMRLTCCLQLPSFVPTLHQNTSLETLPGFDVEKPSFADYQAQVIAVHCILVRNVALARATKLLALHPWTGMSIGSKSGLWCKAFEKFGKPYDGARAVGASAIFYILQKRPALLEPQLRRPRPEQAAAAIAAAAASPSAASALGPSNIKGKRLSAQVSMRDEGKKMNEPSSLSSLESQKKRPRRHSTPTSPG
jgi:hypothetical protein